MKFKGIILGGLGIYSSLGLGVSLPAFGEALHCEGTAPYSEPLNMKFDYDSASDQMASVRYSHADGSDYLLTAMGPFQRTKQDGVYVYTEALQQEWLGDNPQANTLTIETSQLSGTHLKAMLSMPQQGFAAIPMTCSIQGKAIPAESVCPNKDKLNGLLLKASRVGTPEQVASLLACGADVDVKDERGCTPLLIVSDLGCGYRSDASTRPTGSRSVFDVDRLVRILTRAGANIEAQDPVNLQTPLHMAAKYSNMNVARTLGELDAGINAQDTDGETPLILAAGTGEMLNVKTILAFSPDRSLRNKRGMTAYDVARELGANDLLSLLRPVAKTVVFQGGVNGGCNQTMVHVMQDEELEIALQATSTKMFKLDAPDLGIDLMAMPGETVKQTITPSKIGTFSFTCGVHGGPESQQTHGKIMVM